MCLGHLSGKPNKRKKKTTTVGGTKQNMSDVPKSRKFDLYKKKPVMIECTR